MVLAILGAVAVIFALLLLFQRTLYGSALCLLIVLLQVAAMFFAMGAQLLGLMQVMIYAGAIMVLIVVAIMAAPPRLAELWAGYSAPPAVAAAVLFVLVAEFSVVMIFGGPAVPEAGLRVSASSLEREMAALLFGPSAFITELVGVLILVASLSVVPLPVPSLPRVRAPGAGVNAVEPAGSRSPEIAQAKP